MQLHEDAPAHEVLWYVKLQLNGLPVPTQLQEVGPPAQLVWVPVYAQLSVTEGHVL